MARAVVLREIGLRDGLQLVRGDMPTAHKIAWLEAVAAAGVQEIEVTSFVPAKTFPIFADATEVAQAALAIPGLRPSALAVNLRGAQAALDAGLPKLSYVVSASEAHSQANVRRTSEDAADAFVAIVEARAERGLADRVELSCGIATAFGCTLQGAVDPGHVVALAERLVSRGAEEIMLADTVGYAHPGQVKALFTELSRRIPGVRIAGHFHDTRGLGLANVIAAAETGVRAFDGSLGGLGGCPFAPGATGNVNFEDMVCTLDAMGLSTGIDLDVLLAARRQVETWLPQERFTGAILRAGRAKTW
jgi:hydroxymethylglutaryl-CoA lyase